MDNKILVNEEHDNASGDVAKQLEAAQETINEAMEMVKEAASTQKETNEKETYWNQYNEEIKVEEVPEGVTVKVESSVKTNEDENVSFFKTTKWKRIWDKITTGLLIAVMAIPVAILTYILLWFLLK
jgi:hypothetical protein